jgi:serine/threonine protein phosphatase PrpC
MITAFPDVQVIENKGIDFIIMGCDGIWETKTNEDMIKWVQKRISDKSKKLGNILE